MIITEMGPHCTWTPSPHPWSQPPPDMGPDCTGTPLVTSGGHHWKPVQTCSLQDPLLLRYRSRCQDDIFPRIELIPSFVLSSDNTNCKNDIQLFHQLFDELSVHTDYH